MEDGEEGEGDAEGEEEGGGAGAAADPGKTPLHYIGLKTQAGRRLPSGAQGYRMQIGLGRKRVGRPDSVYRT